MNRVCLKGGSAVLKEYWPIPQEMKESATLLEKNMPNGLLMDNVIGVLDVGRMLCAEYNVKDAQNDI